MNIGEYTSLSEAVEASAIAGAFFLTLTLSLSERRTTTVAYRKTFDLRGEDDSDETSNELTVMTALLRQYGKRTGKGRRPFILQFVLGDPMPLFVSDRLVKWLETRAVPRETVPGLLVEQLKDGTAAVVEQTVATGERRAELGALNVESIRKLASSLKVAGAWRTRKADLIELIVEAEQEMVRAS
jgi:hypothetical protein